MGESTPLVRNRNPDKPGNPFVRAALLLLCLGAAGCAGRTAPTPPEIPCPAPDPRLVAQALDRGVTYLRGRQAPEGYWLGTLHNDSSVTGIYVLLARYTGTVDPDREQRAVRFLLDEQGADGGWEQYPGSGGNLDVTLINATALRAAGVSEDAEALRRAGAFVQTRGGIDEANFFTRIFLAMFGQVPWDEIPWITSRLIRNDALIYREGFPRVILIPYMVLYENRRVLNLPSDSRASGGNPDREGAGTGDRYRREEPPHPLLERVEEPASREQCVRWILERQESDGTWAGIVQVTAFSAMALKSCDRPAFDPAIERAVRGVEGYQVEASGGALMQPFSQGPVMDTAQSVSALLEAGVSPEDPSVRRAVAWLLDQQSLREGDWTYGNPEGKPGGWAFEFHNSWYPDVDDTAMVLGALGLLPEDARPPGREAEDRGLSWLLSMQNRDGGFPVWDRNNWIVFNVMKPLFDVGDYSHEDVTARVLVALARLLSREPQARREEMEAAVARARTYLHRAQKRNGSWYGRWGANYTYGTGQVLEGLLVTGSRPADRPVARAVTWLFGVQNPDGGWGEALRSYETGRFEPGESTVAQTAAVLSGLLRAGVRNDPRFERGIRYLLSAQKTDGSWQDHLFYAVNVPRAWYGRYELLSTQAAIQVLSGYRNAPQPGGPGPGAPAPPPP